MKKTFFITPLLITTLGCTSAPVKQEPPARATAPLIQNINTLYHFEPDSISVSNGISQFAKSIVENKKLAVTEVKIEAYSDSIETLDIAKDRANAVANTFIEQGISPKLITTSSFKKESSDCKKDRECEMYYRRVEISVKGYKD